ncbi:ABC transporter ATP-binding protein [Listeria booriae]|uniref:ABC transporter ATP-binding protein n=1 Tax=Listeria booriae TaxID=1552123 RepID=UPI00287FF9CB|nr:ABC transporter ATP-binding protein [Listeria booriae]MDT0109664.1 ABC transporter ATP-binding protein [Listeria booriae]
MSILMHCENICKTYADNTQPTLFNINLTIRENTLYFIKGPSGSGKSTLLNILSLIDTCSSGILKFNNLDISSISTRAKNQLLLNNIGMIFQKYNLLSQLNVIENIMISNLYADFSGKNCVKHKAKQLIQLLHLEGLEERKVNQLSGGQQQRVAIARVLMQEPELLLADEPTANVDKETEAIIMDIFMQYREKGTLIIVSHNDSYADIVDESYELNEGRLSVYG